ncbi:hypothetical protein GCM10009730_60920 [Streptomyces albidochromogenes]
MSRHELGILIARRDGLDASRLPTGLRARSTLPDTLDVLLDSRARYEQHPGNYLAFLGLAAAICCYKRFRNLTM